MPNLVERVKKHKITKFLGIPLLSTFLAFSPLLPIPEARTETKRKNPILVIDKKIYTINNHEVISAYYGDGVVRDLEELRKVAEGFVVLNSIKKKLGLGIKLKIWKYEKIISANELDNKIIKLESELIEKSKNALWFASVAGKLFLNSIVSKDIDGNFRIEDIVKATEEITSNTKLHYLNFASDAFNKMILKRREYNKSIEDFIKENNRLSHKLALQYKDNDLTISGYLGPLADFYAEALRYEFISKEWTDEIVYPLMKRVNLPLAEFTKLATDLIRSMALKTDPFKELFRRMGIEKEKVKKMEESFKKRVDEIVELNYSLLDPDRVVDKYLEAVCKGDYDVYLYMSPRISRFKLRELSKKVSVIKEEQIDDPAALKGIIGGVEVDRFKESGLQRYCGSLSVRKSKHSNGILLEFRSPSGQYGFNYVISDGRRWYIGEILEANDNNREERIKMVKDVIEAHR